MMIDFIEDKDKKQILAEMPTAMPGTEATEQRKMGILVRCTEDIEKAINKLNESMNTNARSNDKLANKIYWLNIVLVVATIVMAITSIITIFK